MKPEAELRRILARWLQLQYPNVIYRFDLAADLKLTMGQARKHKDLHPKRGYPDLFIAEPRSCFHGKSLIEKYLNKEVRHDCRI